MQSTGTRLFTALFGYVTLIILLLTLNPFYLAMPDHVTFTFGSSLKNLILNIVMFLPVGFFYRLTTKRRGALVVGACLSFGIETLQLFIPARTPSILDILTNTLGAGIGSLAYDLISTRLVLSSATVKQLRLETPLMGLVYLLIPLLWMDVLALNETPHRWILTVSLGICGGIIFSDLFRHWLDIVNDRTAAYASLAAGTWFLIGVGPIVLSSPYLLAIGLGILVFTAIITLLRPSISDRRFEQNTLKRLIPIFGLYMALLTLGYPFHSLGTWQVFFGFTNRMSERSLYAIYPRIEYLAAFTVIGYLLAEWRGRLELSLSQDLRRLFALISCIAFTLEILSGFQSGHGASVVRFMLAVAGGLFGGTIYHLSRAHVRFLLGR
ncbi:MAG TPA: VanZ family protein [Anaerolineales bacterium]|nr:VanZ family protein [Anaerolineales bacterium]